MATNGSDDVVDLLARETKAFENLLCHVGADSFVFVKMDAASLRIARSRDGFGNVVKQDGPREGRICIGGEILEHEEQVIEHGSFRMKIGRLFARDGGGDFRQDLFEQAALAKEVEAARGVRRTEEFDQFVANTFRADRADFGRCRFESSKSLGLNSEVELGREADRSEQTKMIFAETLGPLLREVR